jgi:hypothetical protein
MLVGTHKQPRAHYSTLAKRKNDILMIKRLSNFLIGVFLTVFGSWFVYLCILNIQRMGWDIINSEAQIRTLRHPDGEDISQLILSIPCALGGILGGIYYFILSFKKDNNEG